MNNSHTEYPRVGAAYVEAALMGYGVIAYDSGTFCVVWWEGDQKCHHVLLWLECQDCRRIYDPITIQCPTCSSEEEKIA